MRVLCASITAGTKSKIIVDLLGSTRPLLSRKPIRKVGGLRSPLFLMAPSRVEAEDRRLPRFCSSAPFDAALFDGLPSCLPQGSGHAGRVGLFKRASGLKVFDRRIPGGVRSPMPDAGHVR